MISVPNAEAAAPPQRASRLSPDERRAMLVEVTVPLLLEHGHAVTSRQIADAASVAEGTIFRAFGDKESLVKAATAHYLDPEPLRRELRNIDPELPLEEKIGLIIASLQSRFRGIFRLMSVLGGNERPERPQGREEFVFIVEKVLESDAARLNWPASRVAHIARLIAFASSFPQLNDGVEFSVDELTSIVLYGIAGTARTTVEPNRGDA